MSQRSVSALVLAVAGVLAIAGCGSPANGGVAARPGPSAEAPPATSAPAPTLTATRSASATPTKSAAPKSSRNTAAPAPTPRPGLGVPGPGRSRRGTGNATVALTFDDGPDPVNTPALLDILKAHNVKATFCLVGFRARDNPDVVRRIAAEGHTLCNHSWQHLTDLAQRDDSYLWWDLNRTNEAIRAAVPDAKIGYFRAPFGRFTDRLTSFSDRLSMTPIYWDVDDDCWKTKDVNHISAVVQGLTRPGSIILSHENLKPHTVTAYRTLVPWLKARYQLAALPAS
jgi:peptidoglycan/xylan/chitin deacetylase (PgdA/CDA1 family)